MKKQTGIWIDTEKAVIVFLEENSQVVKIINSFIEGRVRIPGEVKLFTRFGNKFLNIDKKKHRSNEIREYLKNVVNEIKDTDDLVIFGPAGMKTELDKFIRNDSVLSSIMRAVKTADSMTENQIIAWVKKYFENKNH